MATLAGGWARGSRARATHHRGRDDGLAAMQATAERRVALTKARQAQEAKAAARPKQAAEEKKRAAEVER